MTAAEMLARTALSQGYDVKKTEVAGHGPARRRGLFPRPFRSRVYSPQIDAGEADLLIGFEAAEALRWLPYLRRLAWPWSTPCASPRQWYRSACTTTPADPIGELAATGIEVHAFDAGAIAEQLGNLKLVNTIMLGAISDYLPFPLRCSGNPSSKAFVPTSPNWRM